jgi:hypothetical protein
MALIVFCGLVRCSVLRSGCRTDVTVRIVRTKQSYLALLLSAVDHSWTRQDHSLRKLVIRHDLQSGQLHCSFILLVVRSIQGIDVRGVIHLLYVHLPDVDTVLGGVLLLSSALYLTLPVVHQAHDALSLILLIIIDPCPITVLL